MYREDLSIIVYDRITPPPLDLFYPVFEVLQDFLKPLLRFFEPVFNQRLAHESLVYSLAAPIFKMSVLERREHA